MVWALVKKFHWLWYHPRFGGDGFKLDFFIKLWELGQASAAVKNLQRPTDIKIGDSRSVLFGGAKKEPVSECHRLGGFDFYKGI
jgi:hypothetical protein